MSPRLRPGLAFAALTCALFAGLGLLWGQETEKASDEPGQAQLRRGARGRRGASGDSEPAPGAFRAGRAAAAAPRDPEKEPVDTSRNRRLAVRIKHAPAQMLANTVGRQYTGVAGVNLVPEPTSNW